VLGLRRRSTLGVELVKKTGDNFGMGNVEMEMSDFERGVNSVGQLFPATISYSEYPAMNSAWKAHCAW